MVRATNNSSGSTASGSAVNNGGDTTSPYYVHPSEGPNSVSITPQLDVTNYLAWARAMRRALGSKNKFHFVDGTIPVPSFNDLNYHAWERCNNLIHSWITNSVSSQIAQSIVFIENVSDVWNELKERFSKADRIRVSKLRSDINNLKQGSLSVSEYFASLKILWDELDSYRPIPICTCPLQCVCLSMRNARDFRLEDQIMQFLTGLNDQFSIVQTQILLMEPLPTLNRVYSLVLQEESKTNLEVLDESKALIHAAASKKPFGRGKGGFSGKRQCTFCGKENHTIDMCYKKHGFPPHFGKRSNASVNNVTTEENEDNVTANLEVSQGSTSHSGPILTQEQYDIFVSLVQQIDANNNQHKGKQVVTNQVKTLAHNGHMPNEASNTGFAFQEDDWFG